MTTWLKDTIKDFFPSPEPLDPYPSPGSKRKASADGESYAKARRYSVDTYRNAPYEPGPSLPASYRPRAFSYRRDSVDALKARRSLEDLKKHWPSDPTVTDQGLWERMGDRLRVAEARANKAVGRLTLKGFDSMFQDDLTSVTDSGSDGNFSGDEGRLPELEQPQVPSRKPSLPTTRRPSVGAPAVPATSHVEFVEEPEIDMSEMWSKEPNKRAREILKKHPLTAKQAIQREVQEPEYALRDAEIRDSLWQLMDLMERLGEDYFSFELDGYYQEARLSKCFRALSPETAKIIGCVASGGPGGVESWKQLFVQSDKRAALALAVVGNVIVEQVFQHMFFGGSKEQIDTLAQMQELHRNEDGFDRNTHYATYIDSILSPSPSTTSHTLPPNFSNHVNYINSVLATHLTPLFALDPANHQSTLPIPHLKQIVTVAGLLSLTMRLDAHTVYYFEPIFKEDTFNSARMECINHQAMQYTNPRTLDDEPLLPAAERAARAATPAAEKSRAKNDDPLTQITILHGVTAYRLGGWETASSTLARPQHEKFEYGDQGVRSRVVTYGWVYCRWGRARRFKDGKAADVEEVHGLAWKGGFREFTDLGGVVDWLASEREGREREREEWVEGMVGNGKGRAVEEEEEGEGGSDEEEEEVQAQLRRELGL